MRAAKWGSALAATSLGDKDRAWSHPALVNLQEERNGSGSGFHLAVYNVSAKFRGGFLGFGGNKSPA